MRLPWKNSQTVVAHALWGVKSRVEALRLKTLSQQPEYHDAKKNGDYEAAFKIVDRLASPEAMDILAREIKPDLFADKPLTRRPIVIAPVKLGAGAGNIIPIAFAHAVANHFGLEVNRDIVQVDRNGRTGTSALYRLLNQSQYTGEVQKRKYIIVDDVYTMGGSLASLTSYIEEGGGEVVCSSVLANQSQQRGNPRDRMKQHELQLSIGDETLGELGKKYGWTFERKFQEAVGFPVGALTHREGTFVAKFFTCQREFFTAVDAERRAVDTARNQADGGYPRNTRGGSKASGAELTY